MKKGKPKGKTPSLIGGSNGRPMRVQVKKRGKCSRCHSTLEIGIHCFAIPKVGGAFANKKRVCSECFQNILRKTADDLGELHNL